MIENAIGEILKAKNLRISTAESCTGGLISSLLTDVAGSSAYITLNFVTYANQAKENILGVSSETILKFGAVSEQCVKEMALGLLRITKSQIALCTSGVAGPGASENKPAGSLWIALGIEGEIYTKFAQFDPNIERKEMKKLFAQEALEFLYAKLVQL